MMIPEVRILIEGLEKKVEENHPARETEKMRKGKKKVVPRAKSEKFQKEGRDQRKEDYQRNSAQKFLRIKDTKIQIEKAR